MGMRSIEVATPADIPAGPLPRRHVVFAVVAIALFMASMDQTIVATALNAIQTDLGAELTWSGWTITVYSLGQIIAMPLAGKLGAAVTAFYVNKGEEYTPDETGSLSLGERITEELEARGQEAIQKSLAIGRTFDVAVEGVMSYGIPADEILNFVEARGIIKMIAMAHLIFLFIGQGQNAQRKYLIDFGTIEEIAGALGGNLRVVVQDDW